MREVGILDVQVDPEPEQEVEGSVQDAEQHHQEDRDLVGAEVPGVAPPGQLGKGQPENLE